MEALLAAVPDEALMLALTSAAQRGLDVISVTSEIGDQFIRDTMLCADVLGRLIPAHEFVVGSIWFTTHRRTRLR